MGDRHALSAVFLGALTEPVRPHFAGMGDLDALLSRAVSAGQTAWPGLGLSPDSFVAYLAEKVAAEARPEGALVDLRAEELYLACACAHGDARALAAFEASYLRDLPAALARLKLEAPRVDEMKQVLRRQLFVGDETSRPKIAQYSGRGDLRGWLRVIAVRAALKAMKKEKRELPSEDERLLEAQADGDDPELAHMKQVYRPAFKSAFQEALESLPAKDRTLLRQNVVDGMSIDEIGALYQVHRATAARWVTNAKESLIKRTRARFMDHVKVSRDECESIMRLVQSQLDATIRRRLIG